MRIQVCRNDSIRTLTRLDHTPARIYRALGISVSTAAGTSSGSSGKIRTDSTGRATISLIYAESYAPWVKINLRAETLVSGTEYSNEAKFVVNGAAADFNDQGVPPAGVVSPFGLTSSSTDCK